MRHHSFMALALLAASSLAVGCSNKPRCARGEQALVGPLAPAATALAEGSVCSIYGGHVGSSPHAQAIFWGERDEMRLLKLKVRVAMQAQGWSEFDPSNAYRRVGDDELNFAQGNQRMRYTFTLTTWRGLVNHSAPAISVDVGGWTDAPRGYR